MNTSLLTPFDRLDDVAARQRLLMIARRLWIHRKMDYAKESVLEYSKRLLLQAALESNQQKKFAARELGTTPRVITYYCRRFGFQLGRI